MLGSQAIQHTASIAGYEIGVPEIFRFGYAHFQSAVSTPGDWAQHDGTEIVFILDGEACWELDDGRLVQLAEGHCSIFPPELKHRITNGVFPPSKSFWMIMSPVTDGQRSAMLTESNRALFANELGRNGLTQKMSDQTITSLNAAIRIMKDKRMYTGSPLLISELRAHLHLITVETWKSHESKQTQAEPDKLVTAALETMHAQLEELPQIADLAKQLGCTRGHLHTIFRRDVGLTPSEYVQRLRMKRACELLPLEETSVTDVALELGFASSQHFAKTFRKYLGITPTDYRNQRKQQSV